MPRVKRGNETSRKTQKATGTRQWIFPNKIQTLPCSQRAVDRGLKVRLLRPQTAQAPIPLAVDRPHRRRRET